MSSFESEKSTFYETESDLSIIHENIIPQIAKIINKRINKNEEKDEYIKLVMEQSNLTFHSNYLPNISFEDYIYRIKKFTQIEDSILTCALIYIDKLIIKGLFINQYNIYRLFLTCIFISCKLFDDRKINIKTFSQIGGINYIELNQLEYEFCSLINFDLFISDKCFNHYHDFINKEIYKNKLIDLYE